MLELNTIKHPSIKLVKPVVLFIMYEILFFLPSSIFLDGESIRLRPHYR